MDNHSGRLGEDYAARLLAEKGYCIVERNFHSRYGEIDIIAVTQQYIAFIEVKTRSENSMVNPLEAVTVAKQQRLIKTAQVYLKGHPVDLQPRFDVIAVITNSIGDRVRSALHLENAFEGVSF